MRRPRLDRNFSPWAHWMALLSQDEVPGPSLSDVPEDGLAEWLQGRRRRLDRLLGPLPLPVPLALGTVSSEPCDGYRRDTIVFDSEKMMSVPAFLLVPDSRDRPGPAVLALHGHGPGKAAVCGLAQTGPNGDYAVQLVRRGYTVLAPDLRGFGQRLDPLPEGYYFCDTNLVHAYMAGCWPLAQNVWDLRRALDVLAQHPLVDARRIGVVGLSYGATMTLFLGATDDRVAAAVVSGYLSSWASSHQVPLNMCGSQVLGAAPSQLEHVDIGALLAPRPLLVETGREDPIFPLAAATGAVAQLGRAYELMGAPDRLEHDVFAGGHQWHGQRAFGFLERWLGS